MTVMRAFEEYTEAMRAMRQHPESVLFKHLALSAYWKLERAQCAAAKEEGPNEQT